MNPFGKTGTKVLFQILEFRFQIFCTSIHQSKISNPNLKFKDEHYTRISSLQQTNHSS
ncbi:hypothetical protein D3C72_663590 [compost metagenome]